MAKGKLKKKNRKLLRLDERRSENAEKRIDRKKKRVTEERWADGQPPAMYGKPPRKIRTMAFDCL